MFASEVVGRARQGAVTRIWQQRGMHMLAIAAERLALRRSFPESVPPDNVPGSSKNGRRAKTCCVPCSSRVPGAS